MGRSRRRRLVCLLALAVGLASSRVARAETGPPEQTIWYGWETLASDAAALALFVGAGVLDDAKNKSSPSAATLDRLSDVALAAGIAVYLIGPPLLHLGRGSGEKTATSAVLRLGLPLAGTIGGVLVSTVACRSNNDGEVSCPLVAGVLGFVSGGIAAMAIDAAVVARKRSAPRPAPTIQPVVVPIAGGASFILGGRF